MMNHYIYLVDNNNKVKGVLDTKETIINLTTTIFGGSSSGTLNEQDQIIMTNLFSKKVFPRIFLMRSTIWGSQENIMATLVSAKNVQPNGIIFAKEMYLVGAFTPSAQFFILRLKETTYAIRYISQLP